MKQVDPPIFKTTNSALSRSGRAKLHLTPCESTSCVKIYFPIYFISRQCECLSVCHVLEAAPTSFIVII